MSEYVTTDADRLEAVIAWAVDYFGDTTLFPAGLAFALWADNQRRLAVTNYCPRRQCRGRLAHSRLLHWFGGLRR